MMTTTIRPSRRQALASLGAGLLPFVPVAARAANVMAPQRLLVVFSPMGYLEDTFWPTRTPDGGFTLGPTMSALAELKSKLIYLDGLILYGASWYFPDDDNEHGSGMAMAFTGSKKMNYATGPSVDQVVAQGIAAQARTPYKSLALGVNSPSPGGHTSCFFSASQQPMNAQKSPKAVFDSIFAGLQPPSTTGPTPADDAAFQRRRMQKQSVIDMVRADLNRICARVGAEEADKCQAHLDALRAVEQRLQATRPVAATGCTKPAAPAAGDLASTIHAQMDLIASAFSCDLTRVATLQLGFCDGGLDMIPGINHHSTTHAVGDTKGAPGPIADHQKIDRWFADRWAYLLKRLDGIKEANGSLLDNTLILFGSDTTTSTSYAFGAHQHWRFPFWLAGGGNFAFKTGRLLTFDHPTHTDRNPPDAKLWTPHNRLLVSICRAFGLDVSTFGNMDPGTGPLAQL
jgi:hypothetical protein